MWDSLIYVGLPLLQLDNVLTPSVGLGTERNHPAAEPWFRQRNCPGLVMRPCVNLLPEQTSSGRDEQCSSCSAASGLSTAGVLRTLLGSCWALWQCS
jgi:hypothetical protein